MSLLMKLGYNTNGLSDHRWDDALELIAKAGYRSVAITVDHHCLDPFAVDFPRQLERYQRALKKLGLSCVIETGARFLLDPLKKHEPTLISGDARARQRRIDFLKRAIHLADDLEADCVSFWSGILREPWPREKTMEILAEGIREVCQHAAHYGIKLGFEPEPGMFIETMADFRELDERVGQPNLDLTIDVGHLYCVEKPVIATSDSNPESSKANELSRNHTAQTCSLRRRQTELLVIPHLLEWGPRIVNVHLEDMRRGVHEHLRFGEGEIDFAAVMQALRDISYQGGLHVELSRHSYMAPQVLQESFEFLSQI
jgi:L-ribulose-5-phosphate 3-epimerase